ncbi:MULTISPECIES: PEPxxWA-CTERM sorting domain-containing protein [unclassified Sphingobium]|uniref:PEPxxWA-CTERM sorting domain-containing protein n=1 Tax=unclassified Sphingobium TaxID=2611147 RepID=UPI002225AAD7|nr:MULTISPECIES: PEPxxWA-CTERM sorting domain-containing protein [unclassified Sphingobium]MCW2349125.1 hypothetical protein [Sphingobium sp. B12D2B]MCW2368254.1 hypothetical protein [Sphingobium sp. B11D3D]
MFKKASGLIAIAALSFSLPAHAAQYMFNFTTSTPLFGGSVTGSGVFTTSDTPMIVGGQTAYAVTSITGQVNGFDIIAPTGSYGNYFTTGPSFLDGTGVTFRTTGSNNQNTVTFFNQSSNGIYRVNTFSPGSSSFVTASSSAVAPVPEPVSWALFIVGFALVGTALRTRRPYLVALTA